MLWWWYFTYTQENHPELHLDALFAIAALSWVFLSLSHNHNLSPPLRCQFMVLGGPHNKMITQPCCLDNIIFFLFLFLFLVFPLLSRTFFCTFYSNDIVLLCKMNVIRMNSPRYNGIFFSFSACFFFELCYIKNIFIQKIRMHVTFVIVIFIFVGWKILDHCVYVSVWLTTVNVWFREWMRNSLQRFEIHSFHCGFHLISFSKIFFLFFILNFIYWNECKAFSLSLSFALWVFDFNLKNFNDRNENLHDLFVCFFWANECISLNEIFSFPLSNHIAAIFDDLFWFFFLVAVNPRDLNCSQNIICICLCFFFILHLI